MGIKNLNNVIKTFTNLNLDYIHLDKFKNMTLAIDANLFIYRFLYGNGNHINGLFFMINKLSKFSIKPIFIFDGRAPKEKQKTLTHRKNIKQKYKDRIIQLQIDLKLEVNMTNQKNILKKIASFEKKLVYINDNIIQSSKNLFDYMGIGYIQAPGEAEHLCAKLSKLNIVDGVISDDTDTLACGANLILRQFTNKNDKILHYKMDEILYELDINLNSFVDLCILLGTDYNSKIRGHTYSEIYKLIRKYKTIENIINETNIEIHMDYRNIRDIFLLKNINVDINLIDIQLSKEPLISSLIHFMKENSSIDRYTYLYRIQKMYNEVDTNNIPFNITNKYQIFDSTYKIKFKSKIPRHSITDTQYLTYSSLESSI